MHTGLTGLTKTHDSGVCFQSWLDNCNGNVACRMRTQRRALRIDMAEQATTKYFCLRQTPGVDDYLSGFAPLPGESVPVTEALGRVLSEDVTVPGDFPSTPRSTRDGYALRSADVARAGREAPVWLRWAGECRMSAGAQGELHAGEAWRVYTGSELPLGADAVVMQENVLEEETSVRVDAPLSAGTHVLPTGADLSSGALLARNGQRLRPQDLALLAQCHHAVPVRRRPVLGILSTGDEFCQRLAGEPGTARMQDGPGQGHADGVHASGSLLLGALARKLGAQTRHLGVSPDDPVELRRRLEAVLSGESPCDVLVITGGSSGGRRDFTSQVLASLSDCRMAGQDQRVSSGRPLTFARVGGLSLWALPGHMLSLFMVAQLFVAPLLLRLMGLPIGQGCECGGHDVAGPAQVRARLARTLPSHGEAPAHFPVTLEQGTRGLSAWPILLGTGKNIVLRDMAGWVTVPGGAGGLPRNRLATVWRFA